MVAGPTLTTLPVSPLSSTGSSGCSRDHYRETTPCCDHNNWDNVRVSKRVMTLRCRECQKQWRVHVETVWNELKCPVYTGEGTCVEGCTKMHVNYRKQNLETRFKMHGESVIDHVRVGRAQEHIWEKVDNLRRQARLSSGSSECRYFSHNPYSWG